MDKTTFRILLVKIVLITFCQSVPDVDFICNEGFYFNKTIQRCSQCSRGCPPTSPILQCGCSAYRDLICTDCPVDTRYNSEIDTCVPTSLIGCPTKTSTRCPETGLCLRNGTMGRDMCVCNTRTRSDQCDTLIVIESESTCFLSRIEPVQRSSDLISYRADNTKIEADAALIGFIVAVCCIGLVVISVFAILVIGIACHNRVIMWQHRRDLRRLRRERRLRDARRQAETERRREQEDSHEDDDSSRGTASQQADNSAIHGNTINMSNLEETVSDENVD